MTIKTIGVAVDPSQARQGGAVVRREFESMGAAAIDFEKMAKKGVDGASASFGALATRVNKATGVTRNYSKDVVSSSVSMGKALHDLQAKWDPIFASSMRYERELNDLNKALKFGVISQSTYNSQLEILGGRFLATGEQAGLASKQFGRMFAAAGGRNNRFIIQNTSNQFADMAVQLEMGTDAARVASQQLPQLLMVFGPLGAALGAAAAVGIPLVSMLFSMSDASGEAVDETQDLADVVTDLGSANSRLQKILSLTVQGSEAVVRQYGVESAAVTDLVAARERLAKDEVYRAVDSSLSVIEKSFGSVTSQVRFMGQETEVTLELLERMGGMTTFKFGAAELGKINHTITDMREETGLTKTAVDQLYVSMAKAKTVDTFEEKTSAVVEMRKALEGAKHELGSLNPVAQEMLSNILKLEGEMTSFGNAGEIAMVKVRNAAQDALGELVQTAFLSTLDDRGRALERANRDFEQASEIMKKAESSQEELTEATQAHGVILASINKKFDEKATEARTRAQKKEANELDRLNRKKIAASDLLARKAGQEHDAAQRFLEQLTLAHLKASGDRSAVADAEYQRQLERIDGLALSEADKATSRLLAFELTEKKKTDILTQEAEKRRDAQVSLASLDIALGGDSEVADAWGDKTSQTETVKEALALRVIAEEEAAELIYQINYNAAKRLDELERSRQAGILSNAELTFSSLSDIAKGFADEQSGIYKAMFAVSKGFAIAQSLIKIQQAAAEVLADPTAFTPAQKIANAAIIAAQGASIVGNLTAVSGKGFQIGGYSGDMATNKVAGVIHGQEYAVNAQGTKRNRATLEAMNRGAVVPLNQGGLKLVIEHRGSPMTYRQAPSSSPGEMRVIAEQVLVERGPDMMAEEAGNSYSSFNQELQGTFAIEKTAS